MTIQAKIIEEVRPEVPDRPTIYMVYKAMSNGWCMHYQSEHIGNAEAKAITCRSACDIIHIPGTEEAARLKKRAELLDRLLLELGTQLDAASYARPRSWLFLQRTKGQIDALDAEHEGRGKDKVPNDQ
jgi:hypothetical protein